MSCVLIVYVYLCVFSKVVLSHWIIKASDYECPNPEF